MRRYICEVWILGKLKWQNVVWANCEEAATLRARYLFEIDHPVLWRKHHGELEIAVALPDSQLEYS